MDLLNGPTETQMKNIMAELGEDEERFEHNLNLLKTWISYQEHLPKNYGNNRIQLNISPSIKDNFFVLFQQIRMFYQYS